MESRASPVPHRVVIVGGGFAGLRAAQALAGVPVEVTLVDRRNFHLFQPLLYQVATGGLSPGDICSPLRHVLRRERNVRVVLGEVLDLDAPRQRIVLSDGWLDYDTLVVAVGSQHHYFGHEKWAKAAPGLKTVEDATEMRRRILLAFETAEREPEHERRHAWLTFVVVGAGPTGVELAGALGEIANDTLRHDFRVIHPPEATILLIEPHGQVLPGYPPDLAAAAKRALEHLGVTVRLGASVTSVDEDGVVVREKESGREQRISSRTVLWAAGVQANALAGKIAAATGADTDSSGRLVVEPDLSLPGHPEILVAGDLAHFAHQGDEPLPALAPVAMAQGRYAGRLIRSRLQGGATPPFRYRDRGTMATIGRTKAVVNLGGLRFAGLFAWITWLFVHLLYLVGFENRLLVLVQWAWSYFTHNRGARLITGENPLPLPLSKEGGEPRRAAAR